MRKLYGSTNWRRVLAFVLVFAMLFSAMGSSGYSVFAESQDETGEAVVAAEPEAVTPEVTEDIQGPSPGEENEEAAEALELIEGLEAEAEEGEESEEAVEAEAAEVEDGEEAEEAAEPVEEAEEGEEPAEPAEEAEEGEEPAEEPAEEAEEGEEPAEPAEEAEEGEEPAEEPAEEAEAEPAEEAAAPAEETLIEEAAQIIENDTVSAGPTSFGPVRFGDTIVSITAEPYSFPAGTTVEIREISLGRTQVAAVANAVDDQIADYKAYDITFYDADGSEIQPAQPVKVNIESEKLAAAENLQVVHIEDNRSATLVDIDETGDGLAFDAEHFSVYVVVETVVPRLTVVFESGGKEIASMIIKEADTENEGDVEMIIYDPGVGELEDGAVFKGWADVEDYTTDTDLLSIAQIRSAAVEKVQTISKDESVTYYAALFKSYTMTFQSDAETPVTVGTASVEYPVYDTSGKASYTINMGYVVDSKHNFEGWRVLDEVSQSHIEDPSVGLVSETAADGTVYKYYPNDTTITVTGDVTFTVHQPEGTWLVFNENGKGASYTAPQFVLKGKTTTTPSNIDSMSRNGYEFGGWYDTAEHAAAHAADTSVTTGEFEFGNKLPENKTIYASWIPHTKAGYMVIFWLQHQDLNGYEVVDSYVNTNGVVDSMIEYNVVENKAEDYVDTFEGMGHYTGFCLRDDCKDLKVTITPEGDAVLNLYYDRIVYNYKFYLYRVLGNATGSYIYANNSGTGSSLNDLVTWHTASSNHPGASSYTIKSEQQTFGNTTYTYYYFTIQAYYGEDISEKWPTYDKIQGADNRVPVSYVMMVGTKLKPTATNQGSGTVKGIVSVMDENILGATNDADGNYVIVRFPDNYYNWRYHLWFEAVDGETHSGTPVEYGGKTYYEEDVLVVRSSNTQVSSQNEPQYNGFDFIGKKGQNWDSNNVNYWQEGGNYHLNYLYNRQQFKISYFDGAYVDGNGNVLETRDSQLLHESALISQGATIADADRNYVPDLPAGQKGYIFEGWYLDKGGKEPYVWGKMPIDGITVYAKWRQIQYRVFLHTGVDSDDGTNLSWGSTSQHFSFRIPYGGKVSTPTGTRDGYDFLGWYTDPEFKNSFTDLYYVLNEDTVTTPYDRTDPTDPETYPYGINAGAEGAFNSDMYDNSTGTLVLRDRFWVNKRLDLYAGWSRVLEDAEGMKVVYEAEGFDFDGNEVKGSGAPTDDSYYLDMAKVTASPAAKAPEGYVFDHWVVESWNGEGYTYTDDSTSVFPGEVFTISADDAKVEDDPNSEIENAKLYTVQLIAIYKAIGEETPTHINWYKNDGTTATYRVDDPVQINAGVSIYGLGKGEEIPSRDGYAFLGWSKDAKVSEPDFLIWTGENYTDLEGNDAEEVAADEKQNEGKYDDLYAIWEEDEVTIYYAVAEGCEGMGSVTNEEGETILAATGKPYGSTAEAVEGYHFAYWTCDEDEEPISTDAEFVPSKNSDGIFEEHTYFAHFTEALTLTVLHCLKGTEILVAEAEEYELSLETTEIDPAEYGPAETFLEEFADFDLQLDSTDPEEPFEVTEDGAVLILYYTISLEIKAKTDSKTYDGEPLTGEYTVKGGFEEDMDAILELLGEAPSITNVKESPLEYLTEEDQAEITDIPEYYDVTYTPGTLTITAAKMTVTATGYEGKYDGASHAASATPSITEGTAIEYSIDGGKTWSKDAPSITNVGTQAFTVRAKNANYENAIANESLIVTPRSITLTSADDSKVYDGTPLKNSNVTVGGDDFAEGEGATYDVTGTVTDPGTAANTFTYTLNEGTLADNYTITSVEGTLTVTRVTKEIVITAESDSKIYDGSPLTNDGYTYTEDVLADGDELTAVVEGTITNVGTAANVVTSYKVMRGETDVTANYTFGESVDGELAITPRSVTLTSADDSKVYDGTPLTNDTVTVSGDGFVEGEGAAYDVTGTITDPGTAENEFTYELNEGTLADNYEIETEFGTLTVTRVTKEIVITADSDSKIYDGTELTKATYTYTEGILADGDELTAVVEGTITDVGTAANVVASYKVMRGETDVTANYTFGESVDGELEITPRSVTLTSADDSKVYDGIALTNDTVTVSGDGFAEGEGATYKVTGTITDPGNVKNAFTYTLNSNTKAGNYEIKTVEGTLIVKSVEDEIIITAASDSKMYDGSPLTNADYTYTEGILAKGDVLTAVVEGTITDVGTAANVVTSYKVMRGETDVTANYTFGDSVDGTLEVTKRSVTLTSASDSKVYDGEPLTNDTVTVSGDGFAEGEDASYNVTGSQTLVDSSKNTFTYTLNEGTKAGNYEIKKVEGTLTVTDGSNPPDTPVDPELVVTKSAPADKFALGAEVTFNITATNIYNEAKTITLSEIDGVTLAQSTFENVAPGATIETTAKYTITEADLKAGSFTNTVTAKLGNITKTAEATVETEAAKTSMKVDKVTTSTPAKDGKYALGEKITYKITALNDGNQTIENFFIVDKLTGDKKFVESLAPGKTEEFAVEYIVKEADILKGYVRNEATVYPTDPKDPDTPLIPDTPDDPPAIPHDPPVIDVPVEDPLPRLSIDKEVTSTPALEAGYALNETVKYMITVKNTGNLTMTGVEVKDDLTGETWTIASLAPGEEKVYEPTYIIKAEDVKAGSVVNVATVSGKPPVEGLDPPPTDDTVTVPTTEETPDRTITVVYYTNYPVDGMDNEYRIYLNVPVPFTWPGFNAVFGADKVPKGFDFVRWNLHTPGQSASSSSSMASEGSVRGLAMMSGSSDATIPDEEKDADFVFYAQWQMRINPNPGGTGYKPEIEDPEPGDDPDPGDEPEPTPPPTPDEEPEEDEEINEPDDPFAGYEEEPDDEIDDNPMPFTPYTGDDRHTAAWGFVSLLSLAGIAVLGRKRREEEE